MNLRKEVRAIFRARVMAGGIKLMDLIVSFSSVLERDHSTRQGRH